jgi:hypothetical protein
VPIVFFEIRKVKAILFLDKIILLPLFTDTNMDAAQAGRVA